MEATTKLPAKNVGGRPPRITGERKEALLNAIRAGNYFEAACRHARVGKTTFYQWMKLGKAQKAGRYAEFRNEVLRAVADAEARLVAEIQKAARPLIDPKTGKVTRHGDWRALAFILERRHWRRWGRKDRIEARVTHTRRAEVDVTHRILADPEVIDALDRAGAREGRALPDAGRDGGEAQRRQVDEDVPSRPSE